MDLSILNELVEIPKKADASKEKKDCYVDQMVNLLKEEGLTEKTIIYIKKGISFSGAKPVAIYMSELSQEDKNSFTEKLFGSSLFMKDEKAFVFRFGVSLMAYSLDWISDCHSLLCGLIKRLPASKYNKDKQPYKDVNKLFENYFLDAMSEDSSLPSLDDVADELKEYHIREFRRLLIECTEIVSKKNQSKAERIREWAGLPAPQIIKSNEDNNVPKDVTPDSPVKEVPIEKTEILIEVNPFERDELSKEIDLFSKRLKETIKIIEKEETKRTLESEQHKRELYFTREQLQRVHLKNEQLEKEISECRDIISDLNIQIKNYNELGELREQKINELNTEIARLNTIISVYSVDKQNSKSEQLNSIASKLKTEYRDFKDAELEEMTVDLGENFRCQLQSIFKTLIKAGIDIERR